MQSKVMVISTASRLLEHIEELVLEDDRPVDKALFTSARTMVGMESMAHELAALMHMSPKNPGFKEYAMSVFEQVAGYIMKVAGEHAAQAPGAITPMAVPRNQSSREELISTLMDLRKRRMNANLSGRMPLWCKIAIESDTSVEDIEMYINMAMENSSKHNF